MNRSKLDKRENTQISNQNYLFCIFSKHFYLNVIIKKINLLLFCENSLQKYKLCSKNASI